MKRFMNKKVATIGLAAGLALGAAGAAFAYFTSSGSGDGTVNVGSSTTVDLTVTTVNDLKPGLTLSIPYSFTNTAGNGAQDFGKVSAVVNSVTPVGTNVCNVGTSAGDANLSTADSASAIGDIADGHTYNSVTGTEPTITMADNGNQDGCQGATISVTLTANQGS